MKTAWVVAWSMRPKAQLSKAKPPASDRAEICRSCFLAQLMAGAKVAVSKARMARSYGGQPHAITSLDCGKYRFCGYDGDQTLSQTISDGSFRYAAGAILGGRRAPCRGRAGRTG